MSMEDPDLFQTKTCLINFGVILSVIYLELITLHSHHKESKKWQVIECKGDVPNTRKGNCSTAIGSNFYVIGGQPELYNLDFYHHLNLGEFQIRFQT